MSYNFSGTTHDFKGAIKRTAGATQAPVGVSMKVSTTAVGNITTGEDVLITYDLPAGTLGTNNDYIDIEAWGTYASNANAKTVKLYFGATAIGTKVLTTGINGTWVAKGKVLRTAATTQDAMDIFYEEHEGTMTGSIGVTTPTETLANAITIKCTGEATETNDIVQEGLTIKWNPAN